MTKRVNFFRALLNILFSIGSVAIIITIFANVAGVEIFDGIFNVPMVIGFTVLDAIIIFCVSLLVQKCKGLKKFLIDNKIKIMLGVMLIVFIAQIFVCSIAYTQIGFDPFHTIRAAGNIDVDTQKEFYDHYFTMYPNNILLTAIFKAFYKIMSVFGIDVWLSSIILNVVAVDIGIIFACLIANSFKSNKIFYITLSLSIILIATSPNITIPYSDTFSIPFTTGVILSAIMIKNAKTNRTKYLFSFLIALFLIGGYYIKPTVIIVGIAMFIYLLLSVKKIDKQKFKTSFLMFAKCALCFVLGVLVCYGAYKISEPIVYYDMPSEQDRYNEQIPMTHHLMMGLNTNDGNLGFDLDDFHSTESVVGKDEKVEYNLSVIKQRASDLGVKGVLKYYLLKGIWCVGDGTFHYGLESTWFHVFEPKAESGLRGTLQNWNYIETPFYQNYYSNFLQSVWLITSIGLVLNIFKPKKEGENNTRLLFILELTIFGLMLFLCIFEPRSRYLILYLPYFIILSANGYNQLVNKILKNK